MGRNNKKIANSPMEEHDLYSASPINDNDEGLINGVILQPPGSTALSLPEANDPEEVPHGTAALAAGARSMASATSRYQNEMQKFSRMCKSNAKDLEKHHTIKETLSHMKSEAQAKDEEILRFKHTVSTLNDTIQEEKAKYSKELEEIERARALVDEERKRFESEKKKQKKRTEVENEQVRIEQEKALEKMTGEVQKSAEEEIKRAKQEFAQRGEILVSEKKGLALEKLGLTKELSAVHGEMDKHKSELEKMKKAKKDQARLKRSLEDENESLHDKLTKIRRDFALEGRGEAFYQKGFTEIVSSVADICEEYFATWRGDLEHDAYQELCKRDCCFLSIPPINGEVAKQLRVVHAQRIISNFILTTVWQPLGSDSTYLTPSFGLLLDRVYQKLKRSVNVSQNHEKVHLWRALTMQGIQAIDLENRAVEPSILKDGPLPTIVKRILEILSPLVAKSQEHSLREALTRVVDAAAAIWNFAQTDSLEFTVHDFLDIDEVGEWWTQDRDDFPIPEDVIAAAREADIIIRFPRITAQSTSEGSPENVERDICIFPGLGLPETASLVVEGKEAVKKREEALQAMKQDYDNNLAKNGHRKSGSSRRNSMSLTALGSTSLSADWKNKGSAAMIEE